MAEGGGEGQATGANTRTSDVFISYASDNSAVAKSVCEALERAGINCWIAPRDVTPGEFYAGSIVHAIDAAKATVLILSQNSAASPHVVREVERAASKRHPVISLRIDKAPLPAELEYFLNTSQWLDASDGEPARVMPKLVAAVRFAIDKPSTPECDRRYTLARVQSRIRWLVPAPQSYRSGVNGDRGVRRVRGLQIMATGASSNCACGGGDHRHSSGSDNRNSYS